MNRFCLPILLILNTFTTVFAQVNSETQTEGGPYKLRLGVDLPLTLGNAALSILGLQRLRNKERLDSAEIISLDRTKINKLDRSATFNHDENAGTYSDYALYASTALPLILLADQSVKKDALKVGALYLETMSFMAVAYTWGVSFTERKRPFVYNPNVPLERKLRRGTTNSLYAGHPAAAAAATFFVAKVYNDYHPNSKLKPFIWGAAVIPPSIVAYYRYRRGQHFPTDILVGIPVGATIGILVPHLHKISKNKGVSITPITGHYNGIALVWTLK
ncbi:MAG TPA: phosphatase PAP2 family protein [Cytophagaceae bacterium]|jgi:hypothetical protein